MKKLIIMMAMSIATVAVNAASFSWTCTGITSLPESTAAAGAGWAVYYLAADTYATALEKVADGSIATWAADNAKYTSATFVTTGRGGGTHASTPDGTKFGTYTTGDSESGYLVILDNAAADKASYYAMTGVVDSDSVTALGNDIKTGFGTFEASTATSAGGSGGWQAVPEPTSGLLMLVGLAGLALRRRRA